MHENILRVSILVIVRKFDPGLVDIGLQWCSHPTSRRSAEPRRFDDGTIGNLSTRYGAVKSVPYIMIVRILSG